LLAARVIATQSTLIGSNGDLRMLDPAK